MILRYVLLRLAHSAPSILMPVAAGCLLVWQQRLRVSSSLMKHKLPMQWLLLVQKPHLCFRLVRANIKEAVLRKVFLLQLLVG